MPMRLTMVGIEKVKAELETISRKFPGALGDALVTELEVEKKESMRRTPVDTGTLRASHTVVGPEVRGNRISAAVAAGGGGAERYAVTVHEDMEAFHKTGQAKFLESTMMESAAYIPARVAKRVKLEK